MVLTTTARGQIIATAPGSVGTAPFAPARTARSGAPPETKEREPTVVVVLVVPAAARVEPVAAGRGAEAARTPTESADPVPTGAGNHRAGRNGAASSPVADRRALAVIGRPQAGAPGRTAGRAITRRAAAARRSGVGPIGARAKATVGSVPVSGALTGTTVPLPKGVGTGLAGLSGPARVPNADRDRRGAMSVGRRPPIHAAEPGGTPIARLPGVRRATVATEAGRSPVARTSVMTAAAPGNDRRAAGATIAAARVGIPAVGTQQTAAEPTGAPVAATGVTTVARRPTAVPAAGIIGAASVTTAVGRDPVPRVIGPTTGIGVTTVGARGPAPTVTGVTTGTAPTTVAACGPVPRAISVRTAVGATTGVVSGLGPRDIGVRTAIGGMTAVRRGPGAIGLRTAIAATTGVVSGLGPRDIGVRTAIGGTTAARRGPSALSVTTVGARGPAPTVTGVTTGTAPTTVAACGPVPRAISVTTAVVTMTGAACRLGPRVIGVTTAIGKRALAGRVTRVRTHSHPTAGRRVMRHATVFAETTTPRSSRVTTAAIAKTGTVVTIAVGRETTAQGIAVTSGSRPATLVAAAGATSGPPPGAGLLPAGTAIAARPTAGPPRPARPMPTPRRGCPSRRWTRRSPRASSTPRPAGISVACRRTSPTGWHAIW